MHYFICGNIYNDMKQKNIEVLSIFITAIFISSQLKTLFYFYNSIVTHFKKTCILYLNIYHIFADVYKNSILKQTEMQSQKYFILFYMLINIIIFYSLIYCRSTLKSIVT